MLYYIRKGMRGTNLLVILSRQSSSQKLFEKVFKNPLTMAERCAIL